MSKPDRYQNTTTLYVLIAVFIFGPLIEGGTTHLPVLVIKELTVIAGLFALYGLYVRGGPGIVRTGLEPPLVLFGLAASYSVYIAPNKYMAMVWVQLFFFYTVFLYLSTYALYRNRSGMRLAAYAVIAAGLLQAAAVLLFREENFSRYNGTFFNPNMMAGYIVPCAAMGMAMAFSGELRKRSRAAIVALAAYIAGCVLLVIMSGSRGGLLSLAVAVSVSLWFRFRFKAMAGLLVIAAVVILVPNPLKDRVMNGEALAYSRLGIWESALERAKDHPAGLGLGNFKYYSGKYNFRIDDAVIKYGKQARTAHNEYLHFASEMGLQGLAAIVLLTAWYGWLLRKAVLATREAGDGFIVRGAVAGIAGILTHSLVDSNLHEPGIVLMLLLLSAVAFSVNAEADPEKTVIAMPPGRLRSLSAAGAVLLAASAVWAALPYVAYYCKEKSVELSKGGRLGEALEYSLRAASFEPLNPDYKSNAAATNFAIFMAAGDRGRLDDCLSLLAEAQEANELADNFPSLEAYVRTEAARRTPEGAGKREMLGLALKAAVRAAELNPYDTQAMYRQATILLQLDRKDEAEEVLKVLAGLEPNYLKGRLLLARLYEITGRRELSKQESRSIIETYESLMSRNLDKNEKEFISFDIEAAKKLLER